MNYKKEWTDATLDGGQQTMNDNAVHIWFINLNDESIENQCLKLLSQDERERAAKFRFEKDRAHFIIARGALRKILGQYLSENPAILTFKYGKNGKPFLPKNTLQFNLSHAGGIALIALTKNHNIGIDVEVINPKVEVEKIAQHFFAKGEINRLMSLPEAQCHEAFFNCWTRKEAFIKATGDGLSFPLDQFEVSLKPDEKAELLATHFDEKERENWTLFDLNVGGGFKAALAVRGTIEEIRYYK